MPVRRYEQAETKNRDDHRRYGYYPISFQKKPKYTWYPREICKSAYSKGEEILVIHTPSSIHQRNSATKK